MSVSHLRLLLKFVIVTLTPLLACQTSRSQDNHKNKAAVEDIRALSEQRRVLIEELHTTQRKADDTTILLTRLKEANESIGGYTNDLRDPAKKSVATREIAKWKDYIADLPSQRELNDALSQAQAQSSSKQIELSNIEAKISDQLDVLRPQQAFKTELSIAFSLLIGGVIFGFYLVGWKDPVVRGSIFAGEAGLQFITLFSLVIAIILFGLTDILEGRELSALLGGISGYILGRSAKTSVTDARNAHDRTDVDAVKDEDSQARMGSGEDAARRE